MFICFCIISAGKKCICEIKNFLERLKKMNAAQLLLPLLSNERQGHKNSKENNLIILMLPHMYKEAYGAFLRLEFQKYSPETYDFMMKSIPWNTVHVS